MLGQEWASDADFVDSNSILILNDGVLTKHSPKGKRDYEVVSELSVEEEVYDFLRVNQAKMFVFIGYKGMSVLNNTGEEVYSHEIENLVSVSVGGQNNESLLAMSIGYKVPMTFRRINLKTGEIEGPRIFPKLDFGMYTNALVNIPNSSLFVVGHPDGNLNVMDLETLSIDKKLEQQSSSITSVATSEDGEFFIAGTEQGGVKIWNTSDWKLVKSID